MKSSPATIMPSPSVARRRALIQADSANKTPVSDGYSLEKYLTVARQLFGFFREAYANLSLDHAFLYGMRYVDLALSLQKHRDSSNETERHLNAQIEYIVSKLEIIKRKMDEEEVLKLRLTGRMQAHAHAQAHTERQQQQQQQQQQQAPTSNRFRRVRVERYNEYNDGRFLDRKQQQQQQQDQPETLGRKAKSKSKFLRLFRPKKTGETVVSSPICQMFAPSSGQIRRSRTTRAEAHFSNAAKATVATSYPPPPPPPIYTVEEDRTYEPPITLKLRSVNTPSLRNLSAEAAAPQYECNVPRPPQQSRGRKSGETCQEKKKHRPVAAPPKIYAPPAPKQTFVRASLPQQQSQSQSPAPPKNETKTSRPIDIHWSPLGFTNDDDEKDGEELLLEEFDRAESPPPPPSSSPPSPPPPPPSLPPSPPPTSCKNSIATRKLSKQCKQHTPRLKPSHSSPSQSTSTSTSTSTSSNGIESKQQPVSISEEFTKNDGLLLSTNHTDRTSIGSCWDSSSTTCWDNDGSKEQSSTAITEAGSSSSVAASTPRRSYNNNDNNTKERIMTEIEKDLRATHKEDTVDQLQLLIDEIKERVSHVYTGHHHVLESGHGSKETIGEDGDEDEDAYTEVIVDDEYDAYTEVIVDEEHDAYTEVIYYEEDDEYTEYIVDDDHTEVIVGGEQKLNDEEINGRAEEKRCLENRFGRGTVSGHNAAVDEGDQDLATTNAGDEYDEYTVAEDIAQPLGMKKSEADCKYTYRFDDVEERNLKSTEMVKESVQNKAPKQQTSLESMATPNLLPFRHPQPRLDPLFHEDLDQSVATIAWLNPVIFDDDEITCITMDQCFRRD